MIDAIVFDNKVKAGDREHYIVMLDYDGISKEEVIRDVRTLQDRFSLYTASLYKTEHGHHVIFFYDPIHEWKACMMVLLASGCDPSYKEVAIKTGKVSTRISVRDGRPDKAFMEDISSIQERPGTLDSLCRKIKEGNKIREMYDRLLKLHIDINEDIWNCH